MQREEKKRDSYREERKRFHPLTGDHGNKLHFAEEGYFWRGETGRQRKSHCLGLFIEDAERYSAFVLLCLSGRSGGYDKIRGGRDWGSWRVFSR